MADEIKNAVNAAAELIPGSHGIFDVVADGKIIFSKDTTGRFPHEGEIAEILNLNSAVGCGAD